MCLLKPYSSKKRSRRQSEQSVRYQRIAWRSLLLEHATGMTLAAGRSPSFHSGVMRFEHSRSFDHWSNMPQISVVPPKEHEMICKRALIPNGAWKVVCDTGTSAQSVIRHGGSKHECTKSPHPTLVMEADDQSPGDRT